MDPTPDGNCQFEGVVDQLRGIGIFRSIASLRSEIVDDLAHRPTTSDGSPLDSLVDNNDLTTYLNDMATLGTNGDHMTLQRAAELYHVQIVLGNSGNLNRPWGWDISQREENITVNHVNWWMPSPLQHSTTHSVELLHSPHLLVDTEEDVGHGSLLPC